MKHFSISNYWTRFRSWLHLHPKAALLLGGAGLIVSASLVTLALLYQKPMTAPIISSVVTKKPTPAQTAYYSQLTGIEVKSKSEETKPVTAIMIENSPDARPQSGLKSAGVVYEAVAEGGITRFLALYQSSKPSLVGPVRSVRPYFVDWLAPYNASVAHVGGSAKALKQVRSKGYRDIDQFFNAETYWRSNDRFAPHNVYTSFKKIDELNKSKGYKVSKFTGFERKNTKPASKLNAKKVAITMSSPLYNLTYSYDKKSKKYLRDMGGVPHKDREKGRIAPRVVIAMKVDERTVFEDGYRESIKTSGSGEAIIFQDGSAQKVTWTKQNPKSQLMFYDKDKEKVALARGQTWISAVPNNEGSVTWK